MWLCVSPVINCGSPRLSNPEPDKLLLSCNSSWICTEPSWSGTLSPTPLANYVYVSTKSWFAKWRAGAGTSARLFSVIRENPISYNSDRDRVVDDRDPCVTKSALTLKLALLHFLGTLVPSTSLHSHQLWANHCHQLCVINGGSCRMTCRERDNSFSSYLRSRWTC